MSNKILITVCFGLTVTTASFMATQHTKSLHAGIGGTWSGAQQNVPDSTTESLKALLQSDYLPMEQRKAALSQLLSRVIIGNMSDDSKLNIRAINHAIKQLESEGVIQLEN